MLGAGAVPPEIIGTGSMVAREWAGAIDYPGPDPDDLTEVAQYQASGLGDPAAVGEHLARTIEAKLTDVTGLTVSDEAHPLRMLTAHPLRVFATTNYDDMIERSLRVAGKAPQSLSCRWWDDEPTPEPERPVEADDPLVFHLHGRYDEPRSMVATKADYLDFVTTLAQRDVLPPTMTEALGDHSLLFIGYSFRDSNFHLILRALQPRRAGIAVLRPPSGLDGAQLEEWMDYFPSYLESLTGCDFDVFWGDGRDFCLALQQRLDGRA